MVALVVPTFVKYKSEGSQKIEIFENDALFFVKKKKETGKAQTHES